MQNKKSGRSKFFLNISLVALLAVTTVSASMMMGCGCSNNASEVSATPDSPVTETRVVSETQIVTEVVDVTGSASENSEGSSGAGSSGSSSSGSSGANNNSNSSAGSSSVNNSNSSAGNNSAGSSANSSANNSNSSAGGSNSSSSNNAGGNSQSSAGGSSSSNNGNSSSVLKIGGKSFSVGDTVTCTLSIKTPDLIENFQGQINYDTKYLECTKAKFLGEARGGSILNYKTNPGTIKFNGSSGVDGYDFTGGAEMIEITYTVKAGGSTTPADKWDIARKLTEDGSGINYINSSGKPSNGMTASLSYSK